MSIFEGILLSVLIICAIAVCVTPNLLTSLIIFMSYSLVMSVLWLILESPDLAITEAAVGAGVTSILFFVTLRKMGEIRTYEDEQASSGETAGEENSDE